MPNLSGSFPPSAQCVRVRCPFDSFLLFSVFRITVLAAICLTQAFMMWKFINFQLRRWREHAQAQTLKKKQAPSKNKPKKDRGEGTRQQGHRGVTASLRINVESPRH